MFKAKLFLFTINNISFFCKKNADKCEEYRAQVVEVAAETDDALMEKFFEEGDLSIEEIKPLALYPFASVIPVERSGQIIGVRIEIIP